MLATMLAGWLISPLAKMAICRVVARISSMARMARCASCGANINDHNFGARVLQLPQDGVGRGNGKPYMAEYHCCQPCCLQSSLQSG